MAFNQLATAGVTIYAITKPLDNALKNIKSELARFSAQKISLASIGGLAAGGAAAGLSLAATSMAAIATVSFAATKSAANLEMQLHRVGTIFGQFAPQVNNTISQISKAFGYTRSELADMSSDLGLMFIGMNLNERTTAQLAKRFIELGTNAAVMYDMGLPEFMQRLEMGVAGSNRALHRMGIFLTDSQKTMEKYRLAAQGVIWTTDEEGERMASLSLIGKRLEATMGQAAWAHKQFGGTLREIKGRLTEMWIAFGEIAKPIWTEAIRGINYVLKQMGEWIDHNKDKFISFTSNIRVYAHVFALSNQRAMQLSGVYFGWFLDIAGAGIVWLQDNWLKAMRDIAMISAYAFKNIAININKFGSWLGENWRELWADLANVVTTTLRNLGANFKTFGEAAYNWIKSGFRKPFEFQAIGLGQGAAPAQAGALPEFKAVLDGFKALSDKLKMPGLDEKKLKEINDDFAKKIAQALAKIIDPKKAGKDNLGQGIPRPGFGMPNRIEGGFVGIADFAKRIQEGALGRDAAMIATARNTQMMANMMAMWGPRLFDVMAMAGVAGP